MFKWLLQTLSFAPARWQAFTQKVQIPAPFFAVISLALAFGLISFLEFPCPACGGTGALTVAVGLKAEVVSSQIIDSVVPLTCCDHPQVQYIYDVVLSVENASAKAISGAVSVSIFDIEPALTSSDVVNPDPEGIFPVQVEVPAGKTITVEQQITFISVSDILNQPHKVTVQSDSTETKGVCPVCSGKGILPFYSWLEKRLK